MQNRFVLREYLPTPAGRVPPVRRRTERDVDLDVVVPDDGPLRPALPYELDDAQSAEFRHVVVAPAHVALDSSEHDAIRHRIYDDGSGEGCFPAGTRRLTAPLELAKQVESGPAFVLEYALSVDDSGDLSMTVDGPRER